MISLETTIDIDISLSDEHNKMSSGNKIPAGMYNQRETEIAKTLRYVFSTLRAGWGGRKQRKTYLFRTTYCLTPLRSY